MGYLKSHGLIECVSSNHLTLGQRVESCVHRLSGGGVAVPSPPQSIIPTQGKWLLSFPAEYHLQLAQVSDEDHPQHTEYRLDTYESGISLVLLYNARRNRLLLS